MSDIRWACGFTGSSGLLFVRVEGEAVLITDGRYGTQAEAEVEGVRLRIADGSLYAYLARHALLSDTHILLQSDAIQLSDFEVLVETCPKVRWRGVRGLLERDVAVKTDAEVAAIRRALAITEAVFEEMLAWMRPGLREHEIAAEIVYRQLRRGATRMSFDPIVASGPHAALPHATPGERALQPGDLVVLDFGCFVDGYASDLTRTVAIGEVSPKARSVYETVLRAQTAALAAARGGMPASDLDRAARSVLEEAGYGPYFTHSLGHGVGLSIHEWPRVSHRTDDRLPVGAVVTIEPGVYLPGELGVRIEDMVVLTEEGVENLTKAPKELITIEAS